MRFDYDKIAPAIGYKLMTSAITPRPVAWVSTLGSSGVVNAAPYSFFNAVGQAPPTLVLGLGADPVRGFKDTARNILETGEFVVNLVPEHLAAAMNETAIDAPSDVSELDLAGLTQAPSHHIRPPRIAESPVSFECSMLTSLVTGPHQTLVVGRILAVHVADEAVLDAERGHIDTPALGLIGRMHGGGWYTRTADLFQLERPKWPKSRG